VKSETAVAAPVRGAYRPLVPNKFSHRPDGVTEIILEKHDGTELVCLVDSKDYDSVKGYRWHANDDGYVVTSVYKDGRRTTLRMHRLFLPDTIEVDHKFGNKLDNRRSEVRPATHSQNRANRSGWSGTSHFKGVCRRKGHRKFQAAIKVQGKMLYLGYFDSEVEAAKKYDEKAREIHGEFARLNFPDVAAGEQAAVAA
jgi:hypothetical protein